MNGPESLRQASQNTADNTASQVATGLAKLALVFRHEAWQATGEHGLTPTQAQILAVVAGAASPIGLSGVAEQLAITAGTASAAVSTLVEKRLVAKKRSKEDARAIQLTLTAKGKRIAASAAEWPETVLAAAACLPDREQAGLVRGLMALIRELQERGSVPTARMCVGCRYFRPNEYPGEAKSHHCAYIDAPIGDSDLRVDCAEMEPASADLAPRLWTLLIDGKRPEPSGSRDAAVSSGA
ncbi:MAG: winged helix-turn-helix transcriptional regulator [Phycisphaerales bacterium]|nr:winged helix-turn-helix transcriptional regulator [Phycisphaerales bacterium]